MKHTAWDNGAIDAAFREALGVGTGQKTSKTRCGKRVSMAHIDNEHPTCGACIADIERENRGLAEIQRYAESLGIKPEARQ